MVPVWAGFIAPDSPPRHKHKLGNLQIELQVLLAWVSKMLPCATHSWFGTCSPRLAAEFKGNDGILNCSTADWRPCLIKWQIDCPAAAWAHYHAFLWIRWNTTLESPLHGWDCLLANVYFMFLHLSDSMPQLLLQQPISINWYSVLWYTWTVETIPISPIHFRGTDPAQHHQPKLVLS